MIRAVLDPGVLVAAAIAPSGLCRRVLDSVLDERYALIVCPLLLTELQDVLLRPKFRRYLTVAQALSYITLIGRVAEARPDPPPRTGLTRDPDDDNLVVLAQLVGADYLVSGDPYLTGLSSFEPPVVTPRTFLERLER